MALLGPLHGDRAELAEEGVFKFWVLLALDCKISLIHSLWDILVNLQII
jgi:hypothetical protein